jgi:hypothetical protein
MARPLTAVVLPASPASRSMCAAGIVKDDCMLVYTFNVGGGAVSLNVGQSTLAGGRTPPWRIQLVHYDRLVIAIAPD